eukprot:Gregarina_sp_Pseudo_9__982@NODE_1631_length_1438_cov_3309_842030_g1507_i1_p1_GENE_NODE_1631_length_1438_cov_3309_842030_g1507_i1NODE_1631_length_1438_cov_3309_842030_g1507_i1_p1_ORF_typecomplete_len413_score53_47Oxidored_FMN/PF00724_20/9_6e105Dus/PF01207_17/1_9e07His_biosynth/PF00977_21/8_8e03His_biosynth/PF00977_21/1_1e03His_biosynth/PF00977_21/0_031IMPDH/PF00478_25/2_7e02IMPDH/PF00478_25/0_45DHO_dh/PF01180_21/0_8B12binding/PF02310_19/0_84NanE/PF04131_14/1_2e03NanE/PF04131_14/2_2e03NanE/PF04131
MTDLPAIQQPLTVRGVTLSNRVVVPPMCMWVAEKGTGLANDEHLVHYGSLAESGAGMIIVEATAIQKGAYISPMDLGLWSDEQVAPLKRITDYVHKKTQTKMAIQLGHAGRKGPLLDWTAPVHKHLGPMDQYGAECMAPSPVAFQSSFHVPKEMTLEDIEALKADYVKAAIRAVAAGFDVIEIHCAHGFLLHSFYSPVSNLRTDKYGGSRENRMRLPLEVAEVVRKAIPDSMPLMFRISCTDWVEGGWTIEDSVELCSELKNRGVDIINCSSGGASEKQDVRIGFLYQVPFADQIKKQAGIKTIAVGGIKTYEDASAIMEEDRADLVAIGRAYLKDVYWLRNEQLSAGTLPWHPTRQNMGFAASLRKQAAAAAAAASK